MIGYLIVAAIGYVVSKKNGWVFGQPTPVAPGGGGGSTALATTATPVIPQTPPRPMPPTIAVESQNMSAQFDTPFLTSAHPVVGNHYPWQPNWRARQPGETRPPWAVMPVTTRDGGPTKTLPPTNKLLPGALIRVDNDFNDWLTPVPPVHSGGGLPGGISPGGGGAPGGGGGGGGGGGHALK